MTNPRTSSWRTATVLALAALTAIVTWLASTGVSSAGNSGSVTLDPTGPEVGEGGTTNVEVVATPPASELSIWIIEVEYDPDIVRVPVNGPSVACDPLDIPGGVSGVAGCDTKDTNSDSNDDTVAVYGGWVENIGGAARGLDSPTTVATVTFEGVGNVGECSDLGITVTAFLDPDGVEHAATATVPSPPLQICVAENVGTQRLFGDVDCDGQISTRDNQALLRNVLQQNPLSQTEPCPDIASNVTVDGTARVFGDLDCDGDVTTRDNQAELRKVLQQNPLSQTEPCPDLGTSVSVAP
jgi:hypothetical protein